MHHSIIELLSSHLRNFRGKQDATSALPIPGEDDFHRSDWSNIYKSSDRSLLFRSVLADPRTEKNARGADRKRPTQKTDAPGGATAAAAKIGEELQSRLNAVRQRGEALARLADPFTARYIDSALNTLKGQVSRIAFIGQMNSGKSSLINVLIERPGFLPTDINPWTTVVTNLHFGAPSSSTEGAVFTFFNWDEWRRLAEGTPRIKELTRLLMPDFDWTSFTEQVNALRGQAEEMLGARFRELAGKSHHYRTVTKDLLEQYICAGSPFDDAEGGSKTGEYSAISKVADLFFPLECFNFPTTLVDTPGVNDPFLVRDEITRQNLEFADIYVVVLTARQPLSQADLNLLRLLRGLNKERIVIFINKIDEVDGIQQYSSEIVARIRELLETQLNFTAVPIILGSASWAKTALSGNRQELAAHLAASTPLGGDPAALFEDMDGFWLDQTSQREVRGSTLLNRSGIPALAEALSTLMQTGSVPNVIDGVGTVLITLAKNSENIARENVGMTSGLLEAMRSGGVEKAPGGLRKRAETVRQLHSDIKNRIDCLEATIGALGQTFSAKLQNDLHALTAGFGEDQSKDFLNRTRKQPGVRWRCDTLPLRRDIEACLCKMLDGLQREIARLQESTARDLHKIANGVANNPSVTIVCGLLPFPPLLPSLAPLSEMVAVDSDSPAWMQWWSQPMPPEERAKHLRSVIGTEFGVIAQRLVKTSEQAIEKLTETVVTHFRVVMSGPFKRWSDELEVLKRVAVGPRARTELENRLAGCRAQLEEYHALGEAADPYTPQAVTERRGRES